MMRKASMVLGIIGGSIALLLALIFIIISINYRGSGHTWLQEDAMASGEVQTDSGVVGEIAFLIAGSCAFAAGVLGLTGGIIVKRKHVVSGVMMIIAAILSLLSYYNVVSMILFVLGAIFALKMPRNAVLYPPAPQNPGNPPEPQQQ